MNNEPGTLTLTPGRRYLVREGSWTVRLEEVRVVARSKTGVYVEHESGNRRWHPLASAGVGKWVIEEDLGPWNPHEARDEAAELREHLVGMLTSAVAESEEDGLIAFKMPASVWGKAAAVALKHESAAVLEALRRLAGGEEQE